MSRRKNLGTVYLLHFDAPYRHARHYIGWADDLDERMVRHRAGRGARLLSVIIAAGIGFRIVRVWLKQDRTFERSLKNRKKAARLCPICNAHVAAELYVAPWMLRAVAEELPL